MLALDEDAVADAIDRLREKRLIGVLTGGSNRVPKYSHRFGERFNLGRRETALLCELMIRGPQTPGELRDRAGRMHRFTDLEEVESCLRGMSELETGPLTVQLPRQPGRKEARYAQLLSGEPDLTQAGGADAGARPTTALETRVAALEQELRELRELVEALLQSNR